MLSVSEDVRRRLQGPSPVVDTGPSDSHGRTMATLRELLKEGCRP